MQHFVIVGILVIVMTVLTYFGIDAVGLAQHMHPIAASAQAGSIDQLWNWEMITISFLFSLIMVPMLYSLAVFRRKKGDTSDGEHIEGNATLEIVWTIVPLFIVLAFAYLGAYSLREVTRIDPQATVIKVRGQQFAWSFEYPEHGGFFSTELHLPVNQQVILKMESADVIHSFWVPEFRVKQDLVPGRVTEYKITPTRIGSYKVRCAELCGTSHAYMENPVIVDSQEAFDKWVAEQQAVAAEAAKTPEGQGRLLVVKNGCLGCHSIDGAKGTGPTWFQLFGSQVPLADGTTVAGDEAYIYESITQPKAKEVLGYSPTSMPQYSFTDEQVANIIAYIKTLR